MDRNSGRKSTAYLGPTVVLFCLVCGLSRLSSAQDNETVNANIGNLHLSVPKDFVTFWSSNQGGQARLSVEFGYPDDEPLGLLRFDRDSAKWTNYQRSVWEHGGQVISVDVASLRKPPTTRNSDEISRVMKILCGRFGEKIEKYSTWDIDFMKCGPLLHTGYSAQYRMSFRYDENIKGWHLSTTNENDRFVLSFNILHPGGLKDWKTIVAHAQRLIDAWKN